MRHLILLALLSLTSASFGAGAPTFGPGGGWISPSFSGTTTFSGTIVGLPTTGTSTYSITSGSANLSGTALTLNSFTQSSSPTNNTIALRAGDGALNATDFYGKTISLTGNSVGTTITIGSATGANAWIAESGSAAFMDTAITGNVTTTGTATAGKFSGNGSLLTNIGNSSLTNSAITINGANKALGDSVTTAAAGPGIALTGPSGGTYTIGVGGSGGILTGGTLAGLTVRSGTMTNTGIYVVSGTEQHTAAILGTTGSFSGIVYSGGANLQTDRAQFNNSGGVTYQIFQTGAAFIFAKSDGGGAEVRGANLTANGGTQSTSTSTGDVTVSGGMGVVKDVFFGGKLSVTGTTTLGSAGTALKNIRHGISAALVSGTIGVTDTATTTSTRYFFTTHTIGTVTVPSAYYTSSRSAGVSFVIQSSQPTDTSTVDWVAFEP